MSDGGTFFDKPLSHDLHDDFLNSFEKTARGGIGLGVFVQDQTTGLLDVPFVSEMLTPSLAVDTVVDSRNITLTAGHGLTTANNAGDHIEITSTINGSYFWSGDILTVTGDVLLLDSPINRIFTTTNSTMSHGVHQMNLDGSVTPIVFRVAPTPLQSGDITRIIVEIRDDADMDFETFGGLPKLTNGLVVRVNNGDGTYRNIWNFKSNGEIILQAFDHEFAVNKGGGTRGFSSRLTFAGQSKHGVTVRLDGALGEALEIIIQDDLTGLTGITWVAQGSELQD